MKNKIFIMGHPKSGNTWLTRLISDCLDEPIIGHNDIDNALNENKSSTKKYHIEKIHVLEKSKAKNLNIIFIVRDVREVLVSGFFHCNRNISEEQIKNNWLIRQYFNYEINLLNRSWRGNPIERLKSLLKFKISSRFIEGWSDYLIKWVDLPNVLVVRYEDLLSDTKNTLESILIKKNIKFNQKNLEHSVKINQFEQRKSFFLKKNDTENYKFLRSGKNESWKNLLSQKLLKKIINKHHKMMQRFNYDIKISEKN